MESTEPIKRGETPKQIQSNAQSESQVKKIYKKKEDFANCQICFNHYDRNNHVPMIFKCGIT